MIQDPNSENHAQFARGTAILSDPTPAGGAFPEQLRRAIGLIEDASAVAMRQAIPGLREDLRHACSVRGGAICRASEELSTAAAGANGEL